ncbi:MAG: menaquinone biosynthesis protein [Thaumarchaeota archaeon]|nr:menaquinone biosynthesis protein [Nitrososphaerota archaeon]MCL5319008.1 menaquinone biosynthesis protein [Nitrososphaerota archaeon]
MLRIGRISFIHNDPAFYYLEKNTPDDVKIISATPRELLNLLLQDHIDFAPISSVSLAAAGSEELVAVPAMSVHSKGPILSAGVVSSRTPKHQRDSIRSGDRISVTEYTETSARMLEAILRARKIEEVTFLKSNYTKSNDLLSEAPLALLIGDEALKTCTGNEEAVMIFDIGEEWWRTMGKPAVFAVSAMRRKWVDENPKETNRILNLVRTSVQYGYSNLDEIIRETASRSDLPKELIAKYFRCVRLDYSADVQASLYNMFKTLEGDYAPIQFLSPYFRQASTS